MADEILQYLPLEKWGDLQKEFQVDFPRGMSGYYCLEVQKTLKETGFDYGFKVYCPHGNVKSGMVALNKKGPVGEVVILCPNDDTKILEEAIKKTKLIDWNEVKMVPFAPPNIVTMLESYSKATGITFDPVGTDQYILENTNVLFDVTLPPNITFKNLSLEHAELVNSLWPHRHPGSIWFYELLIKIKHGYGLFKNNELVAWIFISECGNLNNLYTLENHRKQGYAELLLKLISNHILKEKKDVFGYIVVGNTASLKLFKKLGFQYVYETKWLHPIVKH